MVGRILTASLYIVGKCLFFVGAAPFIRWLGSKNPKILLYHDCSEHESDYLADLECTTSPANFRRQMAYLSRYYQIVPLDVVASGSAPRRSVAITFDDGYASVYENAFPILKERHSPATIYLISSVVDNRALVWVNELNHSLRRHGSAAIECVRRYFNISPEAKPAEVIRTCRLDFSPNKIGALLTDLRKLGGLSESEHSRDARLYLSWEQIEEMRHANVEFGNHSRTHPNMERLTEAEQLAEIEGAQKELGLHLSNVHAFAHPFGHRGPTTASLASRVGLTSAAEVGGHNNPLNPLSLGRTHLTNEHVAGLFSRMEVVEPVKALLRPYLNVQLLK